MSKIEDSKKTKAELIKEVEDLRERVRELKNPIDELTNLYNWVHFLSFAEREFERARRFKRPVSLILIDIDHLKKINSDFNKQSGDQILIEVSKRCKDNIRDLDFIGCYEGGKFILLFLETNKADAKRASDRLRKVIASRPISTSKGEVTVTVSIGVTERSDDTPDISSLLEKAEQALFFAKEQGRNRVEATSS
jgi:two-component system chemotaxis family response regulator WspR